MTAQTPSSGSALNAPPGLPEWGFLATEPRFRKIRLVSFSRKNSRTWTNLAKSGFFSGISPLIGFFRNRIIPRAAPGMAAANSPQCEPCAPDDAKSPYGFYRIGGAGGHIAAGSRQQGGNPQLVDAYGQNTKGGQKSHHCRGDFAGALKNLRNPGAVWQAKAPVPDLHRQVSGNPRLFWPPPPHPSREGTRALNEKILAKGVSPCCGKRHCQFCAKQPCRNGRTPLRPDMRKDRNGGCASACPDSGNAGNGRILKCGSPPWLDGEPMFRAPGACGPCGVCG